MENKMIRSYLLGYVFSILLTMAAYLLVQTHVDGHHSSFSHDFLTYSLFLLAVIQLVVQGIFFLHLGREAKPHWNLLFFISTIGIILIVVVGALWIMNHLNYNMTPQQMDQKILEDELIHP